MKSTHLAKMWMLDGRTALVLGAAGHIGQMVCATLGQLGANIVVSDRDESICAPVAATLRNTGVRAEVCPADLTLEDSVRACVERAGGIFEGLNIVVHTAALVGSSDLQGWAVPFEQQSVHAWDAAMSINLRSAFLVAQSAAPFLREARGSLILFSSIYGMVAPDFALYHGTSMANPFAYGASKGGILQLMRYLATELAPHVRVNAISPGGIERGQPEEFKLRYEERTPLGRMGTESDLVGAVAFLASDMSAYVTGHNLVVDGGWTAW